MNEETKVITYRRAFLLTLFALVGVVAVSAWLWWRSPLNLLIHAAQQTSTASTDGVPSQTTPAETPLAPIQLSPQRMQSIGVKIGTVESKTLSDEIRSYGTVQPNERHFAYVQTRFAGWIR
jgi:hypothetical protein